MKSLQTTDSDESIICIISFSVSFQKQDQMNEVNEGQELDVRNIM
jgi:hypothetical protein